MSFAAACLVPAAPALLPELTGDDVPQLARCRAAVRSALLGLLGSCSDVLVAAVPAPGSLDGFGRTVPSQRAPSGSWPHDLGARLLDTAAERTVCLRSTDLPATIHGAAAWLTVHAPTGQSGTGLLVLADGSTTRGLRAPGGDDPRGADVDDELLAALRAGRAPVLDDERTAAVGCTGAPGVAVLAALAARTAVAAEVRYTNAPLGVGYLVAAWTRPVEPG